MTSKYNCRVVIYARRGFIRSPSHQLQSSNQGRSPQSCVDKTRRIVPVFLIQICIETHLTKHEHSINEPFVCLQCDQIGRFFALWATIQTPVATNILPKLPTLLGNFCKGVKIIHFSIAIIFGQLLQTFGDFYLVTLVGNQLHNEVLIRLLKARSIYG